MEGRWLGRKILATRALQVAGDLTTVEFQKSYGMYKTRVALAYLKVMKSVILRVNFMINRPFKNYNLIFNTFEHHVKATPVLYITLKGVCCNRIKSEELQSDALVSSIIVFSHLYRLLTCAESYMQNQKAFSYRGNR